MLKDKRFAPRLSLAHAFTPADSLDVSKISEEDRHEQIRSSTVESVRQSATL